MLLRRFAVLVGMVSLLAPVSFVSAAKPDHAGGGNGGGGGTAPIIPYVCLDPGHGGSDPGAVYGGVRESDLNLSFANKVAFLLNDQGIASAMTRTDDTARTNNDRYTFCNGTPATALVSIHHNASTDYSVDYTMAMYHQSNSKKLAETVGREVATAVGNSDFRTSRYPSGVLIKSTMPSMMSEGYFMSEYGRQAILSDTAQREALEQQEAQAIVNGLARYFAQQ